METKLCMKIWVVAVAMTAMCVLAVAPGHTATLYDDAISYWTFDDVNNLGHDSREYSNGTLSGTPSWTDQGRISGAIHLDGINDYMNTNITYSASYKTFSFWAKREAGANRIFFGVQTPTDDNRFYVGVTNAEQRLGIGLADSTQNYGNMGSFVDTNWHHYVATWNGLNLLVYMDNSFNVQKSSATSSTGKYYIGAINYHAGTTAFFDGMIDEFAVWGRILTANEIDALYKAGVVSSAMNTSWSLGYSTDEINQLSELYYEGKYGSGNPDPVVVDGTTWQYFATLPEQDGKTLGQAYTVNGKKYVYLGSGIGEPLGGGVPEPSSMAVSGIALGLLGLVKKMRRKKTED